MFCLFRYESMGEVGEKCREQAQKVRKKLHSFFPFFPLTLGISEEETHT